MADLDDVRGATLAGLNAVGMAATIVGVPLVVARRLVRLVRGRPALVVPTALGVAAGLTVATRRTGWSLVKLWLGIDGDRGGPAGRPRPSQASGR